MLSHCSPADGGAGGRGLGGGLGGLVAVGRGAVVVVGGGVGRVVCAVGAGRRGEEHSEHLHSNLHFFLQLCVVCCACSICQFQWAKLPFSLPG